MSKDIAVEILKVVDFDNGVFVECGANDGLFMNNTSTLEFKRGWTGLLVEPSPSAFAACIKNRPNSIVLNYALVSKDYPFPSITGDFDGHPMSSVNGKRRFNSSPSDVTVMATTLSKLLEICNITKIDLFSLDVEGYELEVLRGLDFNIWHPTYILLEVNHLFYDENIFEYLKNRNYTNLGVFSDFNPVDDPYWPGTHQDYLFKYNG